MTPDTADRRKFLLIQPRRMGDVIVTTPVISLLREQFPAAQIDFLTEKEYEGVLSGFPDLNNLITYDRTSFSSMAAAVRRLRRERYDVAFDFFGNPRSAWITLFSGAKKRVGYDYRGRKLAYNVVVPTPKELLYVVRYRMLLPESIGITGETVRPYIFVPKEARQFADALFAEKNIKPDDLVVGVVCPNTRARSSIKNWTREGYAELSKMLAANFKAKIFLLWGPGEERERDRLYLDLAGSAVTHPAVDIKRLAALVKKCDLIVTNCGGTRHVAVAVNTPTLTVYGPTHAVSWTPPDSSEHQVVTADVPCLGCNLEVCEKWDCMRKLTPKDVYRTAARMLTDVLRKRIMKAVKGDRL